MIGTNTGISVRCVLVIQPKGVSENQLVAEDGPRGYWLEADNQNREYRPENRLYVNASCRRSARCLDVLSLLPFGIMRSYPGFCRSKQLEYNPGLTHRRRAGHPRANRRTSDRPSFCGVRPGSCPSAQAGRDFNPRTPCGVRQQNCRNIPGKFAQKLQNFCKAEQRAALPRVGQRESGRYFRPCAVRTSRGKPERFRFASDNERALRSVARLCAEVFDAGFILVSKVIKA